MRAGGLHFIQIERHDKDLLLVGTGFGKDFSGRTGNETLPPELDPFARELFMTHAVGHGHVATVGNGMTALDHLPSGMLTLAMLSFLRRMPADCSGVKENLR